MKKIYRYHPLMFFSLSLLFTSAGFLSAAYFSYQPQSVSNSMLVSLLDFAGMLAPFFITLYMVLSSDNKQIKKYYLSKLLDVRRVHLSYLPFVFLIMPFTWIISILMSHWIFAQSLEQFLIVKGALFSVGIIPAPLMLFGAPLFEELAWKGYGIDSLRERYNFFYSSVVFSIFWMIWHIPTCFPKNFYGNILFHSNILYGINYLLSIIMVGFIINWLWYKNNGFILIAVFLHLSVDFQGILQMGQIAKCIQTVILVIIVAVIIICNKKLYFNKPTDPIGRFSQ